MGIDQGSSGCYYMFPPFDAHLQNELDQITPHLNHLTKAHAFITLASTNDHALWLEKENHQSGIVIMARKQMRGRGRLKRCWLMQDGDIALSILMRPPFLPHNINVLPMIPAVAVVKTLAVLGIVVRLKWPNDIIMPFFHQEPVSYFGHFRKVGGILVENVFRENQLAATIIGIGLNLTDNPALTKQVPHAASLFERGVDRYTCLKHLLTALDHEFSALSQTGYDDDLLRDYSMYCETLGKMVEVEWCNQKLIGRVVAINLDGSLVLDDGLEHHNIFAGDVNFVATC